MSHHGFYHAPHAKYAVVLPGFIGGCIDIFCLNEVAFRGDWTEQQAKDQDCNHFPNLI